MNAPWQFCVRRVAAALLLPAVFQAVAVVAEEQDPFVASGGEVLQERVQIPWYNAETNELEPIPLQTRWDVDLSWLGEWIYWSIVIGIALLVALLAWVFYRIVRDRERARQKVLSADSDPLLVADRVEALPFLRDRSQGDLLGQARHHYEQGNYSEAIIYLFSYQLVELDRSSLIRLAKGKTNRQYLRETSAVRPLAGLLERTMVTFEDVFFGRQPLDRRGFEQCWNQLSEFKQLIAGAQASA